MYIRHSCKLLRTQLVGLHVGFHIDSILCWDLKGDKRVFTIYWGGSESECRKRGAVIEKCARSVMWMLTEDWTQERPTRGWWCGAPTNEEPGEGVSHPELMGAEYTDTDVQREEGHQGFVQYTALDTEHYCCLPPMACIQSVKRKRAHNIF